MPGSKISPPTPRPQTIGEAILAGAVGPSFTSDSVRVGPVDPPAVKDLGSLRAKVSEEGVVLHASDFLINNVNSETLKEMFTNATMAHRQHLADEREANAKLREQVQQQSDRVNKEIAERKAMIDRPVVHATTMSHADKTYQVAETGSFVRYEDLPDAQRYDLLIRHFELDQDGCDSAIVRLFYWADGKDTGHFIYMKLADVPSVKDVRRYLATQKVSPKQVMGWEVTQGRGPVIDRGLVRRQEEQDQSIGPQMPRALMSPAASEPSQEPKSYDSLADRFGFGLRGAALASARVRVLRVTKGKPEGFEGEFTLATAPTLDVLRRVLIDRMGASPDDTFAWHVLQGGKKLGQGFINASDSPIDFTHHKETTMSDTTESKPSLLQRTVTTAKQDANDAAWRTAANQLVKLTRDPLVAMLSRHLGPDDEAMRKKIADFLTTEVGTAMVTAVLSVGLTMAPGMQGQMGQAAERLARELRVKGMADVGDLTADLLMGPLRQIMSLYLQGLPETLPAEETQAEEPRSLPAPTPALTPFDKAVDHDNVVSGRVTF